MRVIHQRERLPLRLEAGDHLASVHAELDDLERDVAIYGFALHGAPHDAAATLTDFLGQRVAANHVADLFAWVRQGRLDQGSLEIHLRALVVSEQFLHAGEQGDVTLTAAGGKGASRRHRQCDCFAENFFVAGHR